jgi:NUDIX domain
MPATPAEAPILRIGARVLLLDQNDHVLLIHAKDPDEPNYHWWELPGGGADPGEALPAANSPRRLASSSITLDLASGTARPVSAIEAKNTTAARQFTSPVSPTRHPPWDPRIPPTRKRDSSATIGGANQNSLAAQTNFSHPTCQPYSPMPSAENSCSLSSSTTSTRLSTSLMTRPHLRQEHGRYVIH